MASTIGIVVIFIIMCALMYTKKLSAFFALPLMAFFIALVSGIPFTDSADKTPGILTLLFVEGPVRLASAMMILIFGAILAQFVKNTGIAEETVRKVSELAGDRPLVLGISFLLVLSLLFTTLGGLGSVIMIGSIVLPIMASVGISPLTCACILLISLSTGGIFNLANWGLYIDGFGMTANEIKLFAWPLGAIFLVFGILFVIVQTKLNGHLFKKKQISWPDPAPATQCKKINPLALLTPIVPLVMVFVLKVNIIGAFTVAIIYCFITTINKDSLKNLSK